MVKPDVVFDGVRFVIEDVGDALLATIAAEIISTSDLSKPAPSFLTRLPAKKHRESWLDGEWSLCARLGNINYHK